LFSPKKIKNTGEKRKLQMPKNKIATLIALFLLFAMLVSLFALPAANAHYPAWTIATFPHI
jgi:hypothetical protein